MKATFLIALVVGLILVPIVAPTSGPIEAVTKDGKTVILDPDGTWRYKDVAPQREAILEKPDRATRVIKSKGFFELWVDPDKWRPTPTWKPGDATCMLIHSSGDAYAMIITERISIPISTLKDAVLMNARIADPNVKLVSEDRLVVNGREVLYLNMKATMKGIPFVYHGYYWSGQAGSAQVFAYTSENLEPEFRNDFFELLKGFVVRDK